MQRHFLFSCQVRRQICERCPRQRLKMGCVSINQPLQAFFDIENVRNACDQLPARTQRASKLSNRVLRILNVFEPFETSNVIKRLIGVGKRSPHVPLSNFYACQTKNLGVKVAAGYVKTLLNQPRGQSPGSGRYVEKLAFGGLL